MKTYKDGIKEAIELCNNKMRTLPKPSERLKFYIAIEQELEAKLNIPLEHEVKPQIAVDELISLYRDLDQRAKQCDENSKLNDEDIKNKDYHYCYQMEGMNLGLKYASQEIFNLLANKGNLSL